VFHHNWLRITGRVLDSRIRTIYHSHHDGALSGPSIPLHSYVVEFRLPTGDTVRREVDQVLETVEVGIGADVPLLVRHDGEKVVLDHKDPGINVLAVRKAQQAADEERFRRQLET